MGIQHQQNDDDIVARYAQQMLQSIQLLGLSSTFTIKELRQRIEPVRGLPIKIVPFVLSRTTSGMSFRALTDEENT